MSLTNMSLPSNKRRPVLTYESRNGSKVINIYKCGECQGYFPSLKSIHDHFKPFDILNGMASCNNLRTAEPFTDVSNNSRRVECQPQENICRRSPSTTEYPDQVYHEDFSDENACKRIISSKRKHKFLDNNSKEISYQIDDKDPVVSKYKSETKDIQDISSNNNSNDVEGENRFPETCGSTTDEMFTDEIDYEYKSANRNGIETATKEINSHLSIKLQRIDSVQNVATVVCNDNDFFMKEQCLEKKSDEDVSMCQFLQEDIQNNLSEQTAGEVGYDSDKDSVIHERNELSKKGDAIDDGNIIKTSTDEKRYSLRKRPDCNYGENNPDADQSDNEYFSGAETDSDFDIDNLSDCDSLSTDTRSQVDIGDLSDIDSQNGNVSLRDECHSVEMKNTGGRKPGVDDMNFTNDMVHVKLEETGKCIASVEISEAAAGNKMKSNTEVPINKSKVRTDKASDRKITESTTNKTLSDRKMTESTTNKTLSDRKMIESTTNKTLNDMKITESTTNKTLSDRKITESTKNKTLNDMKITESTTNKTLSDRKITESTTNKTSSDRKITESTTNTLSDMKITESTTSNVKYYIVIKNCQIDNLSKKPTNEMPVSQMIEEGRHSKNERSHRKIGKIENKKSGHQTHSVANARALDDVSKDMTYRIIQINEKFFCQICHSDFKQISCCKSHVLTEHFNYFAYQQGSEVYTCIACKKHFHRLYYLNAHLEQYHSIYKYTCVKCDKRFNAHRNNHSKNCKRHFRKIFNRKLSCYDCGHFHNCIVSVKEKELINSNSAGNELIFSRIRNSQTKFKKDKVVSDSTGIEEGSTQSNKNQSNSGMEDSSTHGQEDQSSSGLEEVSTNDQEDKSRSDMKESAIHGQKKSSSSVMGECSTYGKEEHPCFELELGTTDDQEKRSSNDTEEVLRHHEDHSYSTLAQEEESISDMKESANHYQEKPSSSGMGECSAQGKKDHSSSDFDIGSSHGQEKHSKSDIKDVIRHNHDDHSGTSMEEGSNNCQDYHFNSDMVESSTHCEGDQSRSYMKELAKHGQDNNTKSFGTNVRNQSSHTTKKNMSASVKENCLGPVKVGDFEAVKDGNFDHLNIDRTSPVEEELLEECEVSLESQKEDIQRPPLQQFDRNKIEHGNKNHVESGNRELSKAQGNNSENNFDIMYNGNFFFCLVCLGKFEDLACCYTHVLLKHYIAKAFKCYICEQVHYTKALYISHLRKIHNLDSVYCDQCFTGYDEIGFRDEHAVSCKQNKVRFSDMAKTNVCKQCFTVHLKMSDQDMTSTCKECEMGFAHIACAKNHFFLKHFPSCVILSSSNTVFRCPCEKVVLTRAELKVHVQTDHGSNLSSQIEAAALREGSLTGSEDIDLDLYLKGFEDGKCIACENFHIIDSKTAGVKESKGTTCKVCKMKFSANTCLRNHMLNTHGDKYNMRQCVGCGLYCAGLEVLERHQKKQFFDNEHETSINESDDCVERTCQRSIPIVECDKCKEVHQHKFLIEELKFNDAKTPDELREEKVNINIRHQQRQKYICIFCEFETECRELLLQHKRQNHEKIQNKKGDFCQVCKKQIDSNIYHLEHIQQEHCSLKFVQGKLLNDFSKHFSCEYCGETFSFLIDAQMHLRRKHFEKPLTVQKHFTSTKNAAVLRGDNAVHCPLCLRYYHNHKELLYHMTGHFTTVAELKQPKKIVCDVCGKILKSKDCLASHKNTHNDFRKFLCKICGKSFVHEPNLYAHYHSHGKKKEECKVCGMKFSLPHHVRAHMKRKHQNICPE